MRIRTLLVMAILSAALPAGSSSAAQCETSIFLFTGNHIPGADKNTQTVTSSAIGCTAIGSDDPNTDYIYPASDSWFVRWTVSSKPAHGSITFDGKTVELAFAPGKLFETVDEPYWDSQWFGVDATKTISGGAAVVQVCVGEAPDEECDTRTYRTIQ